MHVYFEESSLFVNSQHGFQKNHSTHTGLNDFSKVINKSKMMGALLCNLLKAFDRVPHSILTEKLKYYNVAIDSFKLVCIISEWSKSKYW